MRQLTPTINYSPITELEKQYKLSSDPISGLALTGGSYFGATLRNLREQAASPLSAKASIQAELSKLETEKHLHRMASFMAAVDRLQKVPVDIRVLDSKVASAAKKMARSKAISRENSAISSMYQDAPTPVLARFKKMQKQAAIAETSTAEQRRAERRAALMKMRAVWQENNPDGMSDGVAYQKAMRAE